MRLNLKHFFLLFFIGLATFAQKPLNKPKDTGPKTKIELIRADSLIGINGALNQRTFYGNVIFKHRGVLLHCSKAIFNSGSNSIEAYGNININQGDTLTITGDTLFYDGNTRFARIYGRKVILTDDDVVLVSKRMNYDLNIDLAYYPNRGVITQDSAVLSSNSGYYNTKSKLFQYYGDVEIIHPDYIICTDTLNYQSDLGDAVFNSATTITNKEGVLNADKGQYNLRNKQARFFGRSRVENENYFLEADTLKFNNETEDGYGMGNVAFFSKKDSLLLNGNFGEKLSTLGYTKIVGNAIMRKATNSDTLLIAAHKIVAFDKKPLLVLSTDSLLSNIPDTSKFRQTDSLKIDSNINNDLLKTNTIVDSTQNKKAELLVATGQVKIFRSDFQAICDSLIYDLVDSVITFLNKPRIWSKDSQLDADTVLAFMKNNKVSKMDLIQKSFVISIDTVGNFNQIKGRQIEAFFDSNTAIQKINVTGNGESIYFALDDINKLIGLNKVECGRMTLNFSDRKVRKIAFRDAPESKLIPPIEIDGETLKLENFDWDLSKKPTKTSIIGSKIADNKVVPTIN